MREITSFLFKNNKRKIAVYYLTESELKKKKIHKQDSLALMFDAQNGEENTHTCYMRPDEALIIAKLLIQSVFQT